MNEKERRQRQRQRQKQKEKNESTTSLWVGLNIGIICLKSLGKMLKSSQLINDMLKEKGGDK